MRRTARWKALSSVVLVFLLGACAKPESESDEEQPRPTITVMTEDGVEVLEVSSSPTAIARHYAPTETLAVDLEVGGTPPVEFGRIADIAPLAHGAFAVFDRLMVEILVIDASGTRVRGIGREGDGPGEFRLPIALEAVGNRLVAWHDQPPRAFTMFDMEGAVAATGKTYVEGDWERYRVRDPLIDPDGFQRGPEDPARRLHAVGDTAFLHGVQDDEFKAFGAGQLTLEAPQMQVIRFDLDAVPREPVAVMPSPPVEYVPPPLPGAPPSWQEPLYSSRPLWAAGEDWIALAHGDSSAIVVRRTGREPLVIRWRSERFPITDDDKLAAAHWILTIRVIDDSESLRIFEADNSRQRAAGIHWTAFDLTPFAQHAPMAAVMYGDGRCLFVAGHAAEDFVDGTALTWMVFDVQQPSLMKVFRIPAPSFGLPALGREGVAVRGFRDGYAFTVRRDEDGVAFVRRHVIPGIECS